MRLLHIPLISLLVLFSLVWAEYTCESDSDCVKEDLGIYYCQTSFEGSTFYGARCNYFAPAKMNLCDFYCMVPYEEERCPRGFLAY
ncbi:unnamed protein product [Bursaphelenchus xylophilus]|uniref:(pine wood nematode) hypothetical protein n=1 Tax=Bursaphelenchus xylophilus TaxID=6326 RepID=A0A1I7SR70_BURXY|nr:unnamed protein product [Bursaphelenchus xylophilus]CAG9110916.1 unnamed protein product [Bursaphelenchus xylophilus]